MPLSKEFTKSCSEYDVRYALSHIRHANRGEAFWANEQEITDGLYDVAQIIFDTNGKITYTLASIEGELGKLSTLDELIRERSRISPLYYRNVHEGPNTGFERAYQIACENISLRSVHETKQCRIQDILENSEEYEKILWETIDALPEDAINKETQERMLIVKSRIRGAILQLKTESSVHAQAA